VVRTRSCSGSAALVALMTLSTLGLGGCERSCDSARFPAACKAVFDAGQEAIVVTASEDIAPVLGDMSGVVVERTLATQFTYTLKITKSSYWDIEDVAAVISIVADMPLRTFGAANPSAAEQ
jgi:hypothetical protein